MQFDGFTPSPLFEDLRSNFDFQIFDQWPLVSRLREALGEHGRRTLPRVHTLQRRRRRRSASALRRRTPDLSSVACIGLLCDDVALTLKCFIFLLTIAVEKFFSCFPSAVSRRPLY